MKFNLTKLISCLHLFVGFATCFNLYGMERTVGDPARESDIKTAIWNKNNTFSDQEIVIVERSDGSLRYGQIILENQKVIKIKEDHTLAFEQNKTEYPGKEIFIIKVGVIVKGVQYRFLPPDHIGKIVTPIEKLTSTLEKLKDSLQTLGSTLSESK